MAAIPPPSSSDPVRAGSEEVELYQRTYTTLLRSSGETRLRILESGHKAMHSSLHPLAGSDLGFDHRGEPEPQLAEPDGGWIRIHAEDGAGQRLAPNGPAIARLATEHAKLGDPLERVDEERSRSARWIEKSYRRQSLRRDSGGRCRDALSAKQRAHVLV